MREQAHKEQSYKSGYYTVNAIVNGEKQPHIVFAASDLHAARLVRNETGYMAKEHEVEGPYHNF